MRIIDFLSEKCISTNLKGRNKREVLEELVDLLVKAGEIEDKEEMVKVLLEREKLGSTGIGEGIGIPHGKTKTVKKLVAAFGRSEKGIDFDSLDGEPAYLFFLMVAPQDSAGPHLKALARISRLLKEKDFREELMRAQSPEVLFAAIRRKDEEGK
ncbi:MAG: PTS sugar transporter subunit IIA [Candidatus Omnitrophica bacterium]|nr:PTS sugar transporter subunit IIA [Candidatus Omnitrophota bacterium]